MARTKPSKFHASMLLVWPGMWLLVLGELGSRISPEWLPWLAPFGLTHALGWVMVAVGLLWRLVSFRWMKVVVPAAALAVTWPSFNRVFSIGDGFVVKAQTEGWGLLTFNVRRLDEFEWLEGEPTRAELAQWLKERDEVVWCFQEFPSDGKAMLANVQFSFRKQGHRLVAWPDGAGPAVSTSLPVLRSNPWMFDDGAGKGRVMELDVQSPDGPVRIFNVHLQSLYFSEEDYMAVEQGPTKEEGKRLWTMLMHAYQGRALQSNALREAMEASPYPVVVAGDFNDSPVSYAMRRLTGSRVRDAFTVAPIGLGGTHLGTIPGLRIDGVLVDTTLACTAFKTHQIELSDHRPVSVNVWSPSGENP